jgi:hypothetical protein
MKNETAEERRAREKAEIEKVDKELAASLFSGVEGAEVVEEEEEDLSDPLVAALKNVVLDEKKQAREFSNALVAALGDGVSDFLLKLLQKVRRCLWSVGALVDGFPFCGHSL